MHRYRNKSGNSGVVAYELAAGSILIEFNNGERYLYDEQSTGAEDIATMQELAKEGQGLSSFVSQHVGARYARKLT